MTDAGQPAISENSLGPKSLAGFTAKPQFWPNARPMAVKVKPTLNKIKKSN